MEPETLHSLIRRGEILMVTTANGVRAVPSFQFDQQGLRPQMQSLLIILSRYIDP